jgi:putative oxidoreductase
MLSRKIFFFPQQRITIMVSIDTGLLIIRIVVGLLLIGHGAQKLFGWFGGHGFKGTSGFLQSQGFKPALFWTMLGALGEFGGGLLFLFGFLTPLGGIGIFASMLMAIIKMHWSNGVWATNGGYEYPLVLALIGLVGALIGPGSYSLDSLLGISIPLFLVIIGLVLAVIVDLIGLFTSNQVATQQQNTNAA